MNKFKYLIVVVFGLNIAGCTPFHMTLTNEGRSYPATTTEKVQIFFQGEKTPSNKEIGNIVAVTDSETKGVEFLREKAASIGADGITNLEVKIQTQVFIVLIFPIPHHTYFVSGTAVKFIN
jgi:uncharacterized protein YbjQ (UPF0145 family)